MGTRDTLSTNGGHDEDLTGKMTNFQDPFELFGLHHAIATSDPDGVILSVDETFCKIMGYSAEEVIGKNFSFFKSGLHDKVFWQAFWTHIKSGKIWTGVIKNKRKDGTIIVMYTKIIPIIGKNKEITGYLSLRNELKSTEVLNKIKGKYNEVMLRTLTSKRTTELLEGMLHTFNNAIQPLVSHLGILKELVNKREEELRIIPDELVRIEDLRKKTDMDDLLFAEAKQSILAMCFSLDKPLEVIGRFHKMSGTHISTREVFSAKLLSNYLYSVAKDTLVSLEIDYQSHVTQDSCVECNLSEIQEGLMNIFLNAKDVAKKVKFSVFNEHVDVSKGSLLGIAEGEYLCFEIEDDGPGISKEVIESVFTPFFTTKGPQSAGLGLFISKKIFEGNSGTIFIQTLSTQGTQVSVYLPKTEKSVEVFEEKIRSNELSEKKEIKNISRSILFVDDEEDIRSASIELLNILGFDDVIAVSNGREALDMIEQNPERFGLMITDIMMPEMDGCELVNEVAKKYPNLNFVFSSGGKMSKLVSKLSPEVQKRMNGLIETEGDGATMFSLPKPYRIMDLGKTLSYYYSKEQIDKK